MNKTIRVLYDEAPAAVCIPCENWWPDYHQTGSPYAPLMLSAMNGSNGSIPDVYEPTGDQPLDSPSGNGWSLTLGQVIEEIQNSHLYQSLVAADVCEPKFVIMCKGATDPTFSRFAAIDGTGPDFATLAELEALDETGTDDDTAQWKWGYACPYIKGS